MTTDGILAGPEDLAARLMLALTCAAADQALSGVLLFDLDPRLVDPVARLFTGILGGGGTPVMLGATSRDEDLWTRTRLHRGRDGISFRTEPGPLVEGDGSSGRPPLIVVPDLARLSVAGMRAAVQLLGADVAVVEHTGLSLTVRPTARWLVACRSAEAGRLSPHLLDRFAVRLSVAGLRLPLPDVEAWAAVRGALPATVTDEALERVHMLLGPGPSVRRELALARLARAVAAVRGERTATAAHCDAAARIMGLTVPDRPLPIVAADPPQPVPLPSLRRIHSASYRSTSDESVSERETTAPAQPLLETEPAEPIGSNSGGTPAVLATPYPEDETEVLRDFAPLRSPWQRTAGPASARGTVIGTRRAGNLRDLAYVRTVREAAVHQRLRRAERLTILPVDLHSHVRAGTPDRMLVLVLDHTCREDDWDWQDALAPFLHWAYTERAAVQIIEVGGARAVDELRADSFSARSVMHPRVLASLYRPAGRATPLAHGIEEAVRVLRRAFRQPGNGLTEAWVVVVTDGRGNVPLAVSHGGRPPGEVAAAGVTDALQTARRIAAMDRTRVHTAVVDPARATYGYLPGQLADALGGLVIEGRGGQDER
ncbi:magnesium chelatase [Streptomyces sp. NPDC001068]|uniref:magnesium chelatase n=1 Tax=Streptomyces sp. NPDC001068 TaxID=3364544 RepID=UPI0036B34A0E